MEAFRNFSLILLILILAGTMMAEDIHIESRVDRNPVALDEQFTYEVEVSGSVQNLPEVQLPDFENFALIMGPNVSSSFQIVNFKMSASKTYSVVLMPREVGTFEIKPASVQYKGKTHYSNPVNITVTQPAASAQSPQSTPGKKPEIAPEEKEGDFSNIAFLKVVPSKRKVYVNEEVTLRYKIYFRASINDNRVVKLPEAVGCWVEEYPIPQRPRVYTETVNGIQYNVAEIKKMAVFPSRAGKITISPLELQIEAFVRSPQSKRRRSLFDDFFSDPFRQLVTRRLTSGAVDIEVLPIPDEKAPQDFTGLVGDFNIHSSIDKAAVEANQPISYKIIISGTGLLKFLNELPIQFSPDFEVYEPKISQSVNKSGARITSNKEFEYVIIPRVAGEKEIKPVSIAFFNPNDKKFHRISSRGYTIQVARGKEMALGVGSGTVLSKEEVRLLGQDIRFIKEQMPDFVPIGELPYQRAWFYLFLVLPLVLFGVAWVYRTHLEKMSTNVQYARSRKAHKQARNRLKEAHRYWKQGKTSEFYGAVSRALVGFVADKTNKPAAGLLRDDVVQLLHKQAINGDIQNEFLQCLDEADFRRFAVSESDKQNMEQFYKKAEKVLVKISRYF
ncbi:MAG: BatD family protein [Calditrichia bacterium]